VRQVLHLHAIRAEARKSHHDFVQERVEAVVGHVGSEHASGLSDRCQEHKKLLPDKARLREGNLSFHLNQKTWTLTNVSGPSMLLFDKMLVRCLITLPVRILFTVFEVIVGVFKNNLHQLKT
jgi:hypothetical protein